MEISYNYNYLVESTTVVITALSQYQEKLNVSQAIRGHIVLGREMEEEKGRRELPKRSFYE